MFSILSIFFHINEIYEISINESLIEIRAEMISIGDKLDECQFNQFSLYWNKSFSFAIFVNIFGTRFSSHARTNMREKWVNWSRSTFIKEYYFHSLGSHEWILARLSMLLSKFTWHIHAITVFHTYSISFRLFFFFLFILISNEIVYDRMSKYNIWKLDSSIACTNSIKYRNTRWSVYIRR